MVLGGSSAGSPVSEDTHAKYKRLLGLARRQLEENFATFQFWGKVFGKQNDYLVCFGLLPSFDHPVKKFFFCNANKIDLQQLPVLSEGRGYFGGDRAGRRRD